MNLDDVKTSIKKFVSNPNTATFFLVIVLVVVIYFVYDYNVKKAIDPVSVPYANDLIITKSKITSDMVGNIKISGNFVTTSGHNLVQNRGIILNKYVKEGYHIPKNSFFYQEVLVDETEDNKGIGHDMPDGYTIHQMNTSFHETYGCSIMPGNYIDLYINFINPDTGLVAFEPFITSIQVTRVVDAQGVNVFAGNGVEEGTCSPKFLQFTVPEELEQLLGGIDRITKLGKIKLIPVPRNAGYTANPEETKIANEYIKSIIEAEIVRNE